MFVGLEKEYAQFQELFADYAQSYSSKRLKENPKFENFWQALNYSFSNGGKRFRPFLSYLTARTFSFSEKNVMALALAVEFIHTYSLIHDDLPCMDNDDFRRGQPTNHKVYGEAIALLAGDALQSEAFHCLAADVENSAQTKLQLITQFSQNIGTLGMVGGQVLDMQATEAIQISELEEIHRYKTGALIELSCLGVGILAQLPQAVIQSLQVYSENLGLCFQIKDDLLDGLDSEQDFKSYLKILGQEKTQNLLQDHSDKALMALKNIPQSTHLLKTMVEINLNRQK